jgi:Tfp pilus assembly protein PilW
MPRAATESPGESEARSRGGRLATEHGLTLVELLVAVALTLVIGGGALSLMLVSIDQQNAISSRTVAARQAQAGLDQLTRDLSEAMSQDASGNALSVTVSSSSLASTTSISFSIPTPGSATTPRSVTWTCPSTAAASSNVGSCTRTVGSSTTTMIAGVQSMSFSPLNQSGQAMTLPATNPAYISMTLKVQVISQLDHTQPATHVLRGANHGSSNPITIQAGVDLRNFA